jgi:hypothetical protein
VVIHHIEYGVIQVDNIDFTTLLLRISEMELNRIRQRKNRTTPRDGYLLEKEKIKNEIGDLEQIRQGLGLSQRKVCQLLLVDPSAWTRWQNTPGGAPPHIYQSLRWLIELKKVNPDAAAPSDISSRVDFIHSSTQAKIRSLEQTVEMLERAVALAATQQPAAVIEHSRPDDGSWANEIAALKAQMALLIAARQRHKKSQPQRRKANPIKKTRKIKIKAVAKKQKRTVKKTAKKALKQKAKFRRKRR